MKGATDGLRENLGPHVFPVNPPQTSQTQWFEEEVQPWEKALRAYLHRSLPSHADVDDLIQVSYIHLLRAKEKGMIRDTKPLLFSIARNLVRDFLRQRSDDLFVPLTETAALPVLLDKGGVVEHVCRQQELALLDEAIQTLPERCREVILLRKIKGLSQKEIASLLGIAEHTVESLATKGVHRCGAFLRAHGVEPQSRDALES